MTAENWRDIPECHSRYSISSMGHVRSNRTGQILNPYLCKSNGYYMVDLSKGDKKIRIVKTVHRLVALAFIPLVKGKPFVNHINGVKTDNRVENLEWVTRKENAQHASTNNLLRPPRAEKSGKTHLSWNDVSVIRSMYASGNFTSRHIGSCFNIAHSTVLLIVKNKTWNHEQAN